MNFKRLLLGALCALGLSSIENTTETRPYVGIGFGVEPRYTDGWYNGWGYNGWDDGWYGLNSPYYRRYHRWNWGPRYHRHRWHHWR
jgi:hypothetical protein